MPIKFQIFYNNSLGGVDHAECSEISVSEAEEQHNEEINPVPVEDGRDKRRGVVVIADHQEGDENNAKCHENVQHAGTGLRLSKGSK